MAPTVVPGSSSISEWFIHQSAGYLVPVELPPHWYNTKLKGLVVCVVFNANITMGKLGEFICFSVNESGSFYMDDTRLPCIFQKLTTSGLVIDHLSTSLGLWWSV
ncbi:hypothetical protein AAG906_003374 [Vitis piasezkii]